MLESPMLSSARFTCGHRAPQSTLLKTCKLYPHHEVRRASGVCFVRQMLDDTVTRVLLKEAHLATCGTIWDISTYDAASTMSLREMHCQLLFCRPDVRLHVAHVGLFALLMVLGICQVFHPSHQIEVFLRLRPHHLRGGSRACIIERRDADQGEHQPPSHPGCVVTIVAGRSR